MRFLKSCGAYTTGIMSFSPVSKYLPMQHIWTAEVKQCGAYVYKLEPSWILYVLYIYCTVCVLLLLII